MSLEVLHEEPARYVHKPPILCVHGAWHAAWCWQEHFLPYFCQHGFASYALSLRGHGQSDGNMHDASLMDYVQDVASTVENLQPSPILVGHSMGGLIVQKYLETHHEIPAAVLLASIPHTWMGTLRMALRFAVQTPGAFVRFLAKGSLYELVSTPALARQRLFSANLSDKKVVDYFERLQEDSFIARPGQLKTYRPRPQLVKTPILVLGAERDAVLYRREIEATAQAYNSEVSFFNMAHDMMLESGWQQVADRIIDWLESQCL